MEMHTVMLQAVALSKVQYQSEGQGKLGPKSGTFQASQICAECT